MRAPVLGRLLSRVTPHLVIDRNRRAAYGDLSKVTEVGV